MFTASLILRDRFGLLATALAVAANTLLAGMVFLAAPALMRLLGSNGVRVVAKITGVVLAAFAVSLIRGGVLAITENTFK